MVLSLVDGDIGRIEQFYQFQSQQYAVIQLLKNEIFNFTIPQVSLDLSKVLLKINDCFLILKFYKWTFYRKNKREIFIVRKQLKP